MRLDEKLHRQMLHKGLNGQKLARMSRVSDSEISRILAGKSLPGLENAFRLARAVGVSLDFLADDSLEQDPSSTPDVAGEMERMVLKLARDVTPPQAIQVLEVVRIIGYENAMRRLLDARAAMNGAASPLQADPATDPSRTPASATSSQPPMTIPVSRATIA